MPSKRLPRAILIDISENIHRARSFVEGIEFQDFCKDYRTLYAVTRCLEIISEASRRLPDEMKEAHSNIPWRDIAGAGSIYRHGYDIVEEAQLWHTIHHDLPLLLQVTTTELARIPEEGE